MIHVDDLSYAQIVTLGVTASERLVEVGEALDRSATDDRAKISCLQVIDALQQQATLLKECFLASQEEYDGIKKGDLS